jgi:hypothetical protein
MTKQNECNLVAKIIQNRVDLNFIGTGTSRQS